MPETVTLKELSYPNFAEGETRLYYAFLGNRCVFTAIANDDHTSTSSINAVERIIHHIAQKEEIDPRKFDFFDLQTHRMYPERGGAGCAPGEFMFDQILLPNDPRNSCDPPWRRTVWHRVDCPPEVVEAFAEHIGPTPFQMEHDYDRRDRKIG